MNAVGAFTDASRELDRWAEEGLTPKFWLRDDDATRPTEALYRLIALVRKYEVPLLLAVIPAGATEALAARLRDEPLVTPCVHGYAHRNHAPEGEKALELGGDRPAEEVLGELRTGRDRLAELFGGKLSGILVPPWNRMARDIAGRVHEVGFSAVSTWSWQETGTRLPHLNTQVDVMDWEGGRRGRDLDWTGSELLRRLVQARKRGGRPIGILSHHLAHDERAWDTLEGLIRYLQGRGVAFARAGDLVGEVFER